MYNLYLDESVVSIIVGYPSLCWYMYLQLITVAFNILNTFLLQYKM